MTRAALNVASRTSINKFKSRVFVRYEYGAAFSFVFFVLFDSTRCIQIPVLLYIINSYCCSMYVLAAVKKCAALEQVVSLKFEEAWLART